MLYFSAGHGQKTWKKYLTYLSTTGPVISGMDFVIRGGLVCRQWVVLCQIYSQIYGYLILAIHLVLGHHISAYFGAHLYIQ